MSDALLEEFEVLESIYPTELSKLSEKDLQIVVEPEDVDHGADILKAILTLHYTDGYPDVLPELSLESTDEGLELEDSERQELLNELRTVVSNRLALQGEENLGLAMTFTLVSHLRDRLSALVHRRAEKRLREEMEQERLALAEEEARTRGTTVTLESFRAWKLKFDQEQAVKRAKEDEEKLKALSTKEREEWRRIASRLSGRQLFERNKNLEDESLLEEGTVSVDVSQYERLRDEGDELDEDERVTFSDSD
ncbi:hypothetical protein C8J56DRAFT_1005668 [Mycena floridula]|nr:hypothetical protein C8J56DRAFT_1005668 [Mycena floridula]